MWLDRALHKWPGIHLSSMVGLRLASAEERLGTLLSALRRVLGKLRWICRQIPTISNILQHYPNRFPITSHEIIASSLVSPLESRIKLFRIIRLVCGMLWLHVSQERVESRQDVLICLVFFESGQAPGTSTNVLGPLASQFSNCGGVLYIPWPEVAWHFCIISLRKMEKAHSAH